MDYTRDAIQTIRKNAGRVPREEIAGALGWTVPQLERIAAKHEIPLRLFVPTPTLLIDDPPPPDPRYSHPHKRLSRDKLRAVQVTVNLRRPDIATVDKAAAKYALKRSRVAIYIIEGAIARGIADELVAEAIAADRAEPPTRGQTSPE